MYELILIYAIIVSLIMYGIYYYYCSNFVFVIKLEKSLFSKNKPPHRKPKPYPNGWYTLMESSELKQKQVKYIECFGLNLAVFRGETGVVYISDAFCPHLGANLAIGGTVENNCIVCPFHGWKYSGETGLCVNKTLMNCNNCNDNSNNCNDNSIKIEKYHSIEINNQIMLWFHTNKIAPQWYPIGVEEIMNKQYELRGKSEQYIESHIQDIAENIAVMSFNGCR